MYIICKSDKRYNNICFVEDQIKESYDIMNLSTGENWTNVPPEKLKKSFVFSTGLHIAISNNPHLETFIKDLELKIK